MRKLDVELSVRDTIIAALLVLDNENRMPPEERLARAELAERLTKSEGLTDLNENDVALIRHACLISSALPFLRGIINALDAPIQSLQ